VTEDEAVITMLEHPHRSPKPIHRLGFLLVPNFSLIALSSAVDPLRLANMRLSRNALRKRDINCRKTELLHVLLLQTFAPSASQIWRRHQWVNQCSPGINTRHVVPWVGLRPMMPNMLPRVGKGNMANVFYNTGHGHLGWTLPAITADMVGDVVFDTLRQDRNTFVEAVNRITP